MKSLLSLTVFACVLTAAPIPPSAGRVNPIVNGGFEDCPESEANKPLDKGSTAMKGWTVTRGQIDLNTQIGEEWKAAEGKRCLDLHGSPGFGGVEQSITTKPGRKYMVTFKCQATPVCLMKRCNWACGLRGRTRSSRSQWQAGRTPI